MPGNEVRWFTRLSNPADATTSPYTYMHDILSRLPSLTNRQIKDIVPKAWAEATKNAALRAA